jgi:hypothetical protein
MSKDTKGGSVMAAGDNYRIKAADMSARARDEANPDVRTALEQLVLAYLRLAEHADRTGASAIERHPAPPMLQQQQPQPAPKTDPRN